MACQLKIFGSLVCVLMLMATNAAVADEPAKAADKKPAAGADQKAKAKQTRTLGIVLYEGFEPLDVYGPLEVFGNVGPQLKLHLVAEKAGPVKSIQGAATVAEFGFDDCPELD